MTNRFRSWSAVCLVLAGASSANACPLCDSEAGRRVRDGILDAEFVSNLFATMSPFPVFLAIVALIHFGVPWAAVKDRRDAPHSGTDSPPSQASSSEDHEWTQARTDGR